jgi:hypothetical protein
MKNSNQKLMNYTGLATTMLASASLNAQAVGVDINPDLILTTDSNPYSLDFNNDLTPDLNFSVLPISGTQSYMGFPFTYEGLVAGISFPVGNGAYGFASSGSGTSAPGSFTITALENGTPISSSDVFGSSSQNGLAIDVVADGGILGTYAVAIGSFIEASYKFVGAKFQANGNTHYGWVQLSVTPGADSLIIHGYGYNQTPDAAINAGEGGDLAQLENVAIENKVTFFNSLNSAKINVTPDLIGGVINLVNMTGQIIKTQKITDIETVISYEGAETGIYTLNVKFEAASVNKKVYVK